MPKAVLFDLDGTLIDSNAHVIHCFQSAFSEVLGEAITPQQITATFGIPLEQAFVHLNPQHAARLTSAYRNISQEMGDEEITAYPDALEVLQRLKELGCPLAVVTSKKRHKAMAALERFSLAPYIDVIIGPEDTPFHKPDPTPVHLALQALQTEPARAFMVGDSPIDVQSGKRAGTKTVGVRYTMCCLDRLIESKPDYLIDRLIDLIPLAC